MADGEGKRDDGRTKSCAGLAESTGATGASRAAGTTSCDVDRVMDEEVCDCRDVTGSDGVYDMRSQLPMQSMQSGQSTQTTKESRWKGTGRMNRSEL